MQELYELWDCAPSLEELPPLPPFEDFIKTYETIDVGYDCFYADAYVYGPYALRYDEEKFRRDTWGWSAHIHYRYENTGGYCYTSAMPALKCQTARQAYDKLADYLAEM